VEIPRDATLETMIIVDIRFNMPAVNLNFRRKIKMVPVQKCKNYNKLCCGRW
ncbi:MAG: hypothetical protein ACI90V_013906, partial [Bacillariaceae sp.]